MFHETMQKCDTRRSGRNTSHSCVALFLDDSPKLSERRGACFGDTRRTVRMGRRDTGRSAG